MVAQEIYQMRRLNQCCFGVDAQNGNHKHGAIEVLTEQQCLVALRVDLSISMYQILN